MGPARVGSSRVKSHKCVGAGWFEVGSAFSVRFSDISRRAGGVAVAGPRHVPRKREGRVAVGVGCGGTRRAWFVARCMFDVVTMTAYLLSYRVTKQPGALVTGLRSTLKDLPQ